MTKQNFVLVTLHRLNTHGVLSDQHQNTWSNISALVQEASPSIKFSTNFMDDGMFNIFNLLLRSGTGDAKKVGSFYIIMPSEYFDLCTKEYCQFQYDDIKGIPNDKTDPIFRMLKLFMQDFDENSMPKLFHSIIQNMPGPVFDILHSMVRFGCSIYDCDLADNIKRHKDCLSGVVTPESSEILMAQSEYIEDLSNIVQWIKRSFPQDPPTKINICNKNIVSLFSLPKGRLTLLCFESSGHARKLSRVRYDDILRKTEDLCLTYNTSIQVNCIWTLFNDENNGFSEINTLLRDKSYLAKIGDMVKNTMMKKPPWSPILIYEPDVINTPDIVYIYNGQFNKDSLQYISSQMGALNSHNIIAWIEKKLRKHNNIEKRPTVVNKIKKSCNNSTILDYDLVIDVGCPVVDLTGTIRLSIIGGEPIITVNSGTPTIHVSGGAPKITVKRGHPNIKLQGGKPHISYV